ncbi:MAG: MFS transporter [Acidobacteriota bacterium]
MPEDVTLPRRLALVIGANGVLRMSGGASGVLVGLYLADLANQGAALSVALVGTLAAVSFGAELIGAVPLGMLSDAVAPRFLMAGGALLAGGATMAFGLTREVPVFFVSRALEGFAAAASMPAMLAHLSDATAANAARRARVMSFFELSLLAGLALGGLAGSQLWAAIGPRAFLVLAVAYAVGSVVLFLAGTGAKARGSHAAMAGFRRSLREPALRQLAPIWLCMNVILGLWLGPTFVFLLTRESASGQLLAGLLATAPQHLGWVLLGYSLVFGLGLAGWSVVLPRVTVSWALRTALVAMLVVSVGLLMLNHAAGQSLALRWTLTACLALAVMVESGFTPSALSLLAGAVGAQVGRGAAMGIYSFLLSLGALLGNGIAGFLGQRFAVDGLIVATFVLATVALVLLSRLDRVLATAPGRAIA